MRCGRELDQARERRRRNAGARRIEHDQVGLFVPARQESSRRRFARKAGEAAPLCLQIGFQVARRGTLDSTPMTRSKRCASGTVNRPTPAKRSSASLPSASPSTRFDQLRKQKAIHLKKRKVAHAIVVRRRRDRRYARARPVRKRSARRS